MPCLRSSCSSAECGKCSRLVALHHLLVRNLLNCPHCCSLWTDDSFCWQHASCTFPKLLWYHRLPNPVRICGSQCTLQPCVKNQLMLAKSVAQYVSRVAYSAHEWHASSPAGYTTDQELMSGTSNTQCTANENSHHTLSHVRLQLKLLRGAKFGDGCIRLGLRLG